MSNLTDPLRRFKGHVIIDDPYRKDVLSLETQAFIKENFKKNDLRKEGICMARIQSKFCWDGFND